MELFLSHIKIMLNQAELNRASKTLHDICPKLGVRIITPFSLKSGRCCVDCLAFLPDFGSVNGMIIGAIDHSEEASDQKIIKLARENKLFCSLINADAYASEQFEERILKKALEDWGYYGSRDSRPEWFKGYRGGKSLP